MSPKALEVLTVNALMTSLALLDDEAIVCQGDMSYGTCLVEPGPLCTGFVQLNETGTMLDWSDVPKEGYVKAVIL